MTELRNACDFLCSRWGYVLISQKTDDVRWAIKGSRNPAFSYTPSKDLWYDHKSAQGGLLASLFHFYKDDMAGFVTDAEHQKQYGTAKPLAPLSKPDSQFKPKKISEKSYNYTDQHGSVSFQVIRNLYQDNSKSIWQRHKVPNSDKWVNGLAGAILYPYNLIKISKSIDDLIFIVEGEKCADIMNENGFIATTNNGGAGNWKPDINEWFKDRNIVILPDNDQPGMKHANIISKQLQNVAKSIKTLILPVEEPGEDVYDWLTVYGGTAEILLDMVAGLPNLDDEGNEIIPEQPLEVLTWEELMNLPTPEFLISGYLVESSFSVMYGPPANGKTFLALDMALSIATGREWHGRTVKQGAVIYIAAEGVGGLPKRGRAWSQYHGPAEAVPFWTVPLPINFSSKKHVDKLKKAITKIVSISGQSCRAIFVDTVAKSLLGLDENSSTDTGAFISTCSELQKEFKAAVIGIHHSGKDASKGMRGSSAFLGGVDTSLRVSKNDDNIVLLHVEKQKESEPVNDAAFFMHSVPMISHNGENETSIVLVPTEVPIKKSKAEAKAKELSPRLADALAVLKDYLTNNKRSTCSMSEWADWHNKQGNMALHPDPAKCRGERYRDRQALITRGEVLLDKDIVMLKPEPYEGAQYGQAAVQNIPLNIEEDIPF